ncbi:hypothetical protein [Clavibacter capsici]|uniref:hypothetical protein n=1 Tax=Clavibacter capsici TaxID=1874630 RepID=UPI0014281536|nr:hypothetical protein [Clavibacter capsici]QIS38642.1 hypothetical protein GW572_04515 [Clavibacter capsici]
MGFKDKLVAHTTSIGGRCTVGAWYDKQPPDVRSDFDDVMEDAYSFTAVSIANLMRAEYGAKFTGDTLARHRRNACRCAR